MVMMATVVMAVVLTMKMNIMENACWAQTFYFFVFFFFHRKQGDGLFLKTCEQVSKLYPKIKFEGMIVDNTCMQVSMCNFN